MHYPLRPVDPGLIAITSHVVTAHRHLTDQRSGKIHLQHRVVEILFDIGDPLIVEQAAETGHPLGQLTTEPKDFVDIVYRHIRQQTGAIITLGWRQRVFKHRDDLERRTDRPLIQ